MHYNEQVCELFNPKNEIMETLSKETEQQCAIHNVRHCAFQYWDGRKMVEDKSELTLYEAKELWNTHYPDMVEKTREGEDIEVVIWINMENK